ncbi:hypothetical protein ACIO1C_29765 [Streptomyces sp. NPDC087420]|uniref:hypothetical protein n=1 Tax=Streptomyces sp. NPDC087420 TaxID=3365785 RepID=UPI003833459D
MLSIIDPVIRERSWRFNRVISEETLREDMHHAKRSHATVNVWDGEDRKGQPLVIVWVAGRRAGRLFSAFEIAGR